jgi:hypothetical protein
MSAGHWRRQWRRRMRVTTADRIALLFWGVLALGALIIAHTLASDLR